MERVEECKLKDLSGELREEYGIIHLDIESESCDCESKYF